MPDINDPLGTADNRIVALSNRVHELERELASARVTRTATTNSELERYVSDLLPLSMRELPVDVSDIGGELSITIEGVELDAYGHLVRSAIEFEVEGTITIPVRLTIRTTSEDEAHDIASDLLRELADDIEQPGVLEPEEVESVEFDGFSAHSEVDRVREV